MPHILLEPHDDIDIVKSKTFHFIAKGRYDQKICAVVENKEFLLTKVKKNGNILVKIDNATRLTPVSLMKKTLNQYVEESNAKLLFTNTNATDTKIKAEETYIKNIEYFVSDFKTNKEIWVEVGFGSGVHLLHQALQNPDKLIIGLEIHYPSIEQVLKQLKIQNITNVLIVNYDARLFLEFLDSNVVGRVFVHFPVPWDKKPHRRVMSVGFIQECMRVLKVAGTLELRTDSPNYFEYCSSLLEHFKAYPNKILKNKDLDVTSKYEARWKRQEKDIWDITITSIEESAPIEFDSDFSFDSAYNIEEIKEKLPKNPIVGGEFLVNFEDCYDVENKLREKGLLIKVTFGSFNRPVTKYLLLEEGKARYFQGEPIKTKTNLLAHQKILEILK
ncbi:MAG: tRNA (guanosine(46)-N7)-methyltransferase TrmB [Arcobacter sp.]|nr:MAG: tRNA (guanosine(46)-N7)-methyltransferase TrmB [Arcobacter sp.]